MSREFFDQFITTAIQYRTTLAFLAAFIITDHGLARQVEGNMIYQVVTLIVLLIVMSGEMINAHGTVVIFTIYKVMRLLVQHFIWSSAILTSHFLAGFVVCGSLIILANDPLVQWEVFKYMVSGKSSKKTKIKKSSREIDVESLM